jgi:uncharacterized delta-60 repeat protein
MAAFNYKITIWLLLSATLVAANVSAQVALDNSFGIGGIVITPSPNNSAIMAVTLQSDGNIVVAGYSSSLGDNDFQIARYNSNGNLDNSFGNSGIVNTSIDISDVPYSVVVQADGKIIATGTSNSYGVLLRYNINGTLDNSFGNGGIVTNTVGEIYSTAIQADGKIIGGGKAGSQFLVVRYHTNGILDDGFGSGGMVLTSFEGGDYLWSILLQADGKIVCSGSTNSKFALARYNSNGTLDPNFGTNGLVVTDIGPLDVEACTDIALQDDGKIVAAGFSETFMENSYFVLARYNSDGSLDNSFGNNGKIETNNYPRPTGLALQSDGKIVVSGTRYVPGLGTDFSLTRFNTDGTPDNGFGIMGSKAWDIGSGADYTHCLTIQPDQKIIVAGSSKTSTVAPNKSEFTLARFTSDLNNINSHANLNLDIKIYPNPTGENVKIETTIGAIIQTITLHELNGKLIRSFSPMEHLLNIADILPGHYLLKIKTDRGTQTEKIIKQ